MIASGSTARADIISFLNTPGGLYNSGIAGSAYTVSGPGLAGTIPAVTGTAGNFPLNVYQVTTPTSQWLLTQPNPGGLITNQVGLFQFSTTFTLPANLVSATVVGQVSTDDSVQAVLLNGNPIPGFTAGSGMFPAFVPLNITSGFVPGTNTLTFLVNNNSNISNPANIGNPVALNTQFTTANAVTPNAVVPEPATVLALAGLLAGGGLVARRRRAG